MKRGGKSVHGKIVPSVRLRRIVIPYLDHPLRGAGEEHGRHVLVPRDVVDGRVVRGERLEVLGAVLSGALVDEALVRAHEEHGAVGGVERHAASALWNYRGMLLQ